MNTHFRGPINNLNIYKGNYSIEYGPLMLGYENTEKEIYCWDKPEITRKNEMHWEVTEDRKSYEFTPSISSLG